MMLLASCGDEVKIWDPPVFSLLEQFNPHSTAITDFCWSHNGKYIATCSNGDNSVHLKRVSDAGHSISLNSFSLPSNCTCLDFSSLSRYLLCGCIDGSLHIWDCKNQVIKRSVPGLKGPITSIRWNWNDNNIAWGVETGEVILFNVVTGMHSTPLLASSVHAIRQLKYNPYRKASLVSVDDGGVVNFWDTNTRRLVNSFTSTHQAAAKDMAFSPINDCLMVSVGLDKRCVFYDIQNKKPINTIVGEYPLTSVDIMHDGATVVVGTSRGKIYFYDTRQSTTPVFTLPAHKSSVKRLSFIKKEDGKGDSLSSQPLRKQLPTTPDISHSGYVGDSSNNAVATYDSRSNGIEVFSPLSDAHKSNASWAEKTGGGERSSMGSLVRNESSRTSVGYGTGLGIFSPLHKDASLSINSSRHSSFLVGNNSSMNQVAPVIGSAENSVNKETSLVPGREHLLLSANHIEGRDSSYADGDKGGDKSAVVMERNSSQASPPQPFQHRGIGASPSLLHLSSHRSDHTGPAPGCPSSPTRQDRSPTHHAASPTHYLGSSTRSAHSHHSRMSASRQRFRQQSPSSAHPESPLHPTAFPASDPGIAGVNVTNGAQSALHHAENQQNWSQEKSVQIVSKPNNGFNDSIPTKASDTDGSASAATAFSSLSMSPAALRHVVRDLLKEQFQEHQDHLKAEIKAMMGQQFSGQALPKSSMTNVNSDDVSTPAQNRDPGLFQAEFYRNFIREELDYLKDDLKDYVHEEFWCLKIDMFKQMLELQEMFAKTMYFAVNRELLDEIEILREENRRLKKTF